MAGRWASMLLAMPAAPPPDALDRVAQPRQLIVTLYGLYARHDSGWFSVSALIRLLAETGVEEAAVRSSISRLKRRGLLRSESVGGTAGYGLSELGRQILAEGDQRIFARPRAGVEDGWLLAVFSVPESERDMRHLLRARLRWLGFGTAAPGVWIAPAHLQAETREVLGRHDLARYVDLFEASYLAFGDLRTQVTRWWDLPELQDLYQSFIDGYGPTLRRWRRRVDVPASSQTFADYITMVTAWRRLPFLDPGLPAEVLPPDWHGTRAADIFAELGSLLAAGAEQFVESVVRNPPVRSTTG